MNATQSIGNATGQYAALIATASYCDLIEQSLGNIGVPTTGYNCSMISFIQKTAVSQVAVAGANGASSNVGSSQTVTLSFFQSNSQALTVQGLTTPISIWIPRGSNAAVPSYQTISANYTNTLQCPYNDLFLQNTFNVNSSSSIHIQFKPANNNSITGYLFLLKFGSIPQLNSSFSNYDQWQLYCPSDATTQLGDTFFLFFLNQSHVANFSGNVDIAIRELTSSETNSYCSKNVNSYNLTAPPILTSFTSSSNSTSAGCKAISNDLNLRIFLSGCFYMNPSTGAYTSDGTVVQPDTTLLSTHCHVYHCTEFAGGFIVLPAAINFNSVFSGDNASFAKNPILYATVFSIIGLYVVLAVLCRWMDMRDRYKKGLTLLNGRRTNNLYEIIIFTGNRRNAGTDSNVFMSMHGNTEKSHVIELKDKKRKLFRRGGLDTFIVATEQYTFLF
jgi:hypothetical protein